MHLYHVTGRIEYLRHCPKAPGVDLCDPPPSCDGHTFWAEVDLYIDAPDAERAEHAALKKLSGPYPWPLFAEPAVVTLADLPTFASARRAPEGPMFPGFAEAMGLGEEGESVTLSGNGKSVTLRRRPRIVGRGN